MSVETRALIAQHVESFPVKESHYRNRVYRYLDAKLNCKILHTTFLTNYPNNKVGYDYFLRYFHENFDLSFGRPLVDSCCKCEDIKVKLKNPHLNDAAKHVAHGELAVHR